MDIRVTGKNIKVGEAMKAHLREKLSKFEKYAPRLVDSQVVLKQEKYLFVAEITLLAKNLRAYGEAQAKDNIYAAIDGAYERVEKQLKRYREKVKDHHKKTAQRDNRGAAAEETEAPSRERRPRIQRTRSFTAARPLFLEDASQELQESEKPFLIFQNASTQKVNVLFKREDGNHGLVEPEF